MEHGNHLTRVFLVWGVLAQAAPLAARDYYVAAEGGDDAWEGTVERPLATIQRAANLVNPGDVVRIAPGRHVRPSGRSFIVELRRGGRADAPVVFTRWGDEGEALLDGEGTATVGFYVNGRYGPVDHVVIRHLTVARASGNGIYLRDSSHSLVDRCRSIENGGFGIFVGTSTGGGGAGSHQVVQYCEAAGNRRTGIRIGDNLEGIPHPHHVVVQYNHVHHNVDPGYPGNTDGIALGGPEADFCVIRGNVVHGNSDDGIDTGNGADFTMIERNVVFDHTYPGGDCSGIKIGTHETHNPPNGGVLVRYNVLFDNALRHFDLAGNYRDGETDRPPPLVLHNNTCYDARGDVVYAEEADVILFNNIAWDLDNGPFWSVRLRKGGSGDPAAASADRNLWKDRWIKDWDERLRTDLDGHSIDLAPGFADAGNPAPVTDLGSPAFGDVPGLRLASGSPAIDRGVEPRAEIARLLDEARRDGNDKWVEALAFALVMTPEPVQYSGASADLGAFEASADGAAPVAFEWKGGKLLRGGLPELAEDDGARMRAFSGAGPEDRPRQAVAVFSWDARGIPDDHAVRVALQASTDEDSPTWVELSAVSRRTGRRERSGAFSVAGRRDTEAVFDLAGPASDYADPETGWLAVRVEHFSAAPGEPFKSRIDLARLSGRPADR